MLWAYFDESGEHDKPTGALTHMTLGGCVADSVDWQALEVEWGQVLVDAQVPCFHMVDFEARKGVFEHFPEEKRKPLLNALLGIMISRVHRFVGFEISAANAVANSGPWHNFKGTKGTIENVIYYAASEVEERYQVPDGQRISMVWAKHKEVKQTYFDKVRYELEPEDDRLIRSMTVAEPIDVAPLQAADIWAYELSRRARANHPERYPFRRLRGAGKPMKSFMMTGGMPL